MGAELLVLHVHHTGLAIRLRLTGNDRNLVVLQDVVVHWLRCAQNAGFAGDRLDLIWRIVELRSRAELRILRFVHRLVMLNLLRQREPNQDSLL